MSAKWLWGSTQIFVSEEDIARETKRAELFVLDSTVSIWHFFGAGSEKRMIKGLVIGETDRAAIIADAIGDTTRTLTTPYGAATGLKINGTPKFTPLKYAGAVIDGVSYASDVTPLYTCELELITA
jgi:hypothetical protein